MEQVKKITVYIMGKAYKVPADQTIMGALEYAGYQLVRGVGCREGFCGSCATIYRKPGDYKFHMAPACSTLVEDQMYLSQIPFVPTDKPVYNIEKLEPDYTAFEKVFPETFRCVACNTCTKACPQDLEVMDYIQAIIKNNISECADLSFDCIACGLCAIRCPAEMVQHNIGLLSRRLYGKYLNPRGKNLKNRLQEIKEGKYEQEIRQMMTMDKDNLVKTYHGRDIEPDYRDVGAD
ncbi:MAG: 4Fe-4S dicluster domain-containing protein [Candidatus Omnitrophota bacterium]|nr:MAG: 4Fe-4S dicluster domain-containing protein [Candidatus Omnitrophota bacterium]